MQCATLQQSRIGVRRCFATSSVSSAVKARAIIYEKNGEPSKIIRGHQYTLDDPKSGQVLIQVGLASINPADINVLQGVYPGKPAKRKLTGLEQEVFIGGNEGYGIIQQVHDGNSSLRPGDWVVFGKPQMGTWSSHMVVDQQDVIKIKRSNSNSLTPIMASTLQVNPATAYRMLTDFQKLNKGDVIIQNAANSAVGQAVVQIASRKFQVETINLIRSRANMDSVHSMFSDMSSNGEPAHLFTYEDLANRESGAKDKIKKILNGRNIKLGLNAVCGQDNSNMAKLMGTGSTIVTYGAMSKQPFSVPAGLIIFQDFTLKGFMMNQWYGKHSTEERQMLMKDLVAWYEEGSLQPPLSKIISFEEKDTIDDITKKAREAVQQSTQGFSSEKMLFRFL